MQLEFEQLLLLFNDASYEMSARIAVLQKTPDQAHGARV